MTIKRIIKYTLAGAALTGTLSNSVANAKNINKNNKDEQQTKSKGDKIRSPTIIDDENIVGTPLSNLPCVQNSDCPHNSICSKLSSKCFCPHGFSGQSCQLTNPKIICAPEKISIQISKSWLQESSSRREDDENNNNSITSPDQLYLGFDPYNKNCQAVQDPNNPENYYLQVTEENPCGTKVEYNNTYVYTNQVSTQINSEHRQAISEQLIQSNILAELTEEISESEKNLQNFDETELHSRKKRSLQSSLNDLDRLGLINWSCTYSKSITDDSNNYSEATINKNFSKTSSNNKIKMTSTNNEISIKAFSDETFQNCQTSTVYEGQKLFLQLFTPEQTEKNNFDIKSCALRQIDESFKKSDENLIEIFSKKNCMSENEKFPSTEMIKNENNLIQFSFDLDGLPEEFLKTENSQFFVHCKVVDGDSISGCDVDDDDNNESRRAKREDLDSAITTLEVGPFILKQNILPIANLLEESPNHEISKIINLLSKLNLQSENTETKSDLNSMLNNLKTASRLSTPVIKINELYQLEEYELPGPIYKYLNEFGVRDSDDSDFIQVSDFTDNYDIEEQRQRVRNMVVLAISIGILIICLIGLPILYVYFKNSMFSMKHKEFENDFSEENDIEKSDPNNNSNDMTTMGNVINRIISKMSNVAGRKDPNNNENNGKKDNRTTSANNKTGANNIAPNQIITMDTGLHVDHALHFVEYTDHIHDLVFEDSEGYNDTSMWIKQMSTDTQSIDISNQDPIKMTYTDSMYNKNASLGALGGSLTANSARMNRRRYSSSNSSLNSSIINGTHRPTATQPVQVKDMRSASLQNNLKVNRGSSMTSIDRNGSVNIIHCSQDQHRIVVRTNSSASSSQGSINSFQGGTNNNENRGFGGHNNSHSAIHKIQNRINSMSQVRNSRNSSKINIEKIDLPNPSYVQTGSNRMDEPKGGRKKSFRLAGVKNTNLSVAVQ